MFFLVCPPECGNLSCTEDGTCCHEQCLGGCTGPNHDDCFACKYLADERDCVKECPVDTLTVSNVNSMKRIILNLYIFFYSIKTGVVL